MEVHLDRFGRLVMPKVIREHFGLFPGSRLRIEEHRDEIVLKPLTQESDLIVKDQVLVFKGIPTDDLNAAIRADRHNRDQKLARRLKK